MSFPHKNLTGADAIHPAAYSQSSDPGAVGADKLWIDTTTSAPYALKKRNTANTSWDLVGVAPTATLTVGALDVAGLTGATQDSRYTGATSSGIPTTGTFAIGDYIVDRAGKFWVCTVAGSPGTWVQVGQTISGSSSVTNGQSIGFQALTELLAIAAAATSATTIQIPAAGIVLAVNVRVTVAIPTAATFTVTGNTSGTTFSTAAVSTAVDTTNAGTAAGAFYNSAAQTIRITPNATPANANGRVRVTIYYLLSTPPTS